jgi:hypothetical protein
MSHWLKMWWLFGCGSLVRDVVVHWLEMWWLISSRYGGSLGGDRFCTLQCIGKP